MLEDKTILIVEGEVLIALDIQRSIAGENPHNVLFARAADEVPDPLPRLDLAVVEIAPGNSHGLELARRLLAADVPCVLTSTDHPAHLLAVDLKHLPVLLKPFSEEQLLASIRAMLAISGSPQVE